MLKKTIIFLFLLYKHIFKKMARTRGTFNIHRNNENVGRKRLKKLAGIPRKLRRPGFGKINLSEGKKTRGAERVRLNNNKCKQKCTDVCADKTRVYDRRLQSRREYQQQYRQRVKDGDHIPQKRNRL